MGYPGKGVTERARRRSDGRRGRDPSGSAGCDWRPSVWVAPFGFRVSWCERATPPRASGASWAGFYGVALLAGIGFTMSLFVTSLAFEYAGPAGSVSGDRLGILIGSGLSALAGFLVLRLFRPGRV